MQNFIGNLFAQVWNGKKEYFLTPTKEMDFIITVRNKPVLAGEVKWGKYDYADVRKFVEKSGFIDTEKVFVTKTKKEMEVEGVKIMDAGDLVSLSGSNML